MRGNGKQTVVIAEALALVRDGVAALAESFGTYQVVGRCEDGVAVFELIEALRPHFAVLDLNLPKLFPLEVTRKVRRTGIGTKMIVLGTKDDRKTVIEALHSGASAYVLKNGPGEHLRQAFEQAGRGGVYVSPLIDLTAVFLSGAKPAIADPLELLSRREFQVLSLLVSGLRAKEVAYRLALSPKTIDTYRASLMRKLDIHDLPGLVRYAIQRKLIPG